MKNRNIVGAPSFENIRNNTTLVRSKVVGEAPVHVDLLREKNKDGYLFLLHNLVK